LEDRALFDGAFTQFRGAVFAFLYGQVGSRETSADLLQETFVRVWLHIGDLRAMKMTDRPRWVFSIARNLVTDSRRREAARPRTASVDVDRPAPLAGPDQVAIGRETLSRLDQAILELPIDLRTVLTMSVMEELSSGEIGRMLGRPAATIRYQLAEARKQIAKKVLP